MKFILTIITLSGLLVTTTALAKDPTWFACQDVKSITGIENGPHPYLKVGLLKDTDDKTYLLIKGQIETSSSGYSYTFQLNELDAGTQKATLTLIAPDIGLAAIDKLSINEKIEYHHTIKRLNIRFEKPFNWGPDSVTCDLG